MSEVHIEGRVFVIALIVSAVTTLLFGGMPSLQAGAFDIQCLLQRAERAGLDPDPISPNDC